jgi:hypothetical protein
VLNEIVIFAAGAAFVSVLFLLRRRFAGFAGQTADDYNEEFPQFDMRTHLNGPMICEGVIFGPLGRMSSTFVAEFDIVWDGNSCTMKEEFFYNDGSIQHREWRIELDGGGSFVAEADDVPGKANGEISGPVLLFRYPIRLPAESGGHTLRAFDCMYLTKSGTVVNRSQFRKFGFKVAELVATIRKKEMA